MMLALDLVINRTKLGAGIRAVAQDAETAQLMGVDVNKVISRTFLIGGLLGGVGGVLYGMFHAVTYTMGFLPGIKAFTAAVLGGIGNVRGAMLGGLLLGIVESFSQAQFQLQWVDVVAFVVLVGVLLIRPDRHPGRADGEGGVTTSISELSAQVRQLRSHDAWWKNPRWVRLLSVIALFLVLSILTNQLQGSPSDYTLVFKNSWFSARGAKFVIGGVVIWVIAEVWRTRGLSRIAAQATQPVRQVKNIAVLRNPWVKRGSLLALVVVAVLLPYIGLFSTSYFQSVLSDQVGVFVLAAVGLNVVVGWAGLLDLGYIAFFAIGAYTTAILSGRLPIGADGNPEAHPPIHLNLFFAFPIAVLLTMAAGLILGAPTLRLRGDYLAIVTLGFHEIVLNIASNDPKNITGGALGATDISTFRFNLFGDPLRLEYQRLQTVLVPGDRHDHRRGVRVPAAGALQGRPGLDGDPRGRGGRRRLGRADGEVQADGLRDRRLHLRLRRGAGHARRSPRSRRRTSRCRCRSWCWPTSSSAAWAR